MPAFSASRLVWSVTASDDAVILDDAREVGWQIDIANHGQEAVELATVNPRKRS